MREVPRVSLTIPETCDATGLSRHTVEALIKFDLLKGIKTGNDGNRKVILLDDIIQLMEYARDYNFVLNDDPSNIARIKDTIDELRKYNRFKRK